MRLSEFNFDLIFRSGKLNNTPVALSQANFASIQDNTLYDIHDAFCHLGITRLYHFVRVKNLPYSIYTILSNSVSLPVWLSVCLFYLL